VSRQTLSTLLRAAIAAAGFQSTYAAAMAMGIDNRWLGQILAGEVSPTVDTLEKLFGAIGWEVTITFQPRE
jgi:transcriptional regulator with XRE-family HTH domain